MCSAKLPSVAPEPKPKPTPPAAPVVVEHLDNLPIDDTESREKIAFGLKRKAGSIEESSSKKPKENN